MSDVQLTNGYTELANELLEAMFKVKLNGTQFRLLNFIIRFTYGYKRKTHKMSNSFISKGTGINVKQINRELKNLVEKNIVYVAYKGDYTNPREIGLNKDYSTWKCKNLINNVISNTLECRNELSDSNCLGGCSGSELVTNLPSDLLPNKQSIKTNIKTNDYTKEFEIFYNIYPNPINKELTYKNYLNAVKKDNFEVILIATNNYINVIESKGTDKQYIFKSTNFVGNHMEYKNYINCEITPIEKPYWENIEG